MKEYLRTDRNGTRHYRETVDCDRCHGTGEYTWGPMIAYGPGAPAHPMYHGICFKCNGSGRITRETLEHTPEHAARIAAEKEARRPQTWEEQQRAKREAMREETLRKAREHRAKLEARLAEK